jgi:hypothetical protein
LAQADACAWEDQWATAGSTVLLQMKTLFGVMENDQLQSRFLTLANHPGNS